MQIRIPSVNTTLYALAFVLMAVGVVAALVTITDNEPTSNGGPAILFGLYLWYKAEQRSKRTSEPTS